MDYILFLWGSLPVIAKSFVILTSVLGVLLLTRFYSETTLIYGPTVLVSIGIFGTFFGIALGLSEFDTRDIQGSIPGLLDGLKTSFWSSISGLFFALLIKVRHLGALMGAPVEKGGYEGANIDDLANLLDSLNKSISGDEDDTLLSQVKLTRQDSNDRFDRLQGSFENFLKEMAQSNSEALIEALNEVIRDFNTKINEQFGENFKQLNSAVGKILEWQEVYRQQMEEMIKQQTITSTNMGQATERYKALVENASAFKDIAEEQGRLLEEMSFQRSAIQESMTGLASVLEKAKDGLPQLENKVIELTTTVSKAVQDSNAQTISTITSANKEMNAHLADISEKTRAQINDLDEALSTELTKALEMLGMQMTALSQKFVEDYTPLTNRLREVVQMSKGV